MIISWISLYCHVISVVYFCKRYAYFKIQTDIFNLHLHINQSEIFVGISQILILFQSYRLTITCLW